MESREKAAIIIGVLAIVGMGLFVVGAVAIHRRSHTAKSKTSSMKAEPERRDQVTTPTQPRRLDVIEKAIFGVHLGETVSQLKKRKRLSEFDSEGELATYRVSEDHEVTVRVGVYDGRVIAIICRFNDDSDAHYMALADVIDKRYTITPTFIGVAKIGGTTNIDGVPIQIALEKQSDSIKLTYIHAQLGKKWQKAEENSKVDRYEHQL